MMKENQMTPQSNFKLSIYQKIIFCEGLYWRMAAKRRALFVYAVRCLWFFITSGCVM